MEQAQAKRHQSGINRTALRAYKKGDGPLSAVLKLTREDLNALREEGLSLLSQGKARQCLQVFELLESLGDRGATVYLIISCCHNQLGNNNQAGRYFRRGLSLAENLQDQDLVKSALSWGSHLLEDERLAS